jgi:short subunit dehydrogenase-like uncharacterized protein
MTVPWGDVSTAYYTTGIPNIEVYMASSRGLGGQEQPLPIGCALRALTVFSSHRSKPCRLTHG